MSSIIDFAQLTLQGRLTDDPEMGTTSGGSTYCRFRVATNRRMGKDKEKTSFIPVTVFGTDAANCGKFLTKGRAVHVTGDFETDKYEDREGNKRTGFGVVAKSVIFGPGGSMSEDGPGESRSGSARAQDANRDGGYNSGSRGEPSGGDRDRGGEYIRKGRGRGYDKG
jgi:single-strand DNA-binding protein